MISALLTLIELATVQCLLSPRASRLQLESQEIATFWNNMDIESICSWVHSLDDPKSNSAWLQTIVAELCNYR